MATIDMVIKTSLPHCHGSTLCSFNQRKFRVVEVIRTKRGRVFPPEQVCFKHLITLI